MAATELQKRSISLVILVGILGSFLALMPLAEGWLQNAFVTSTMTANVVDTSLRILKIILWMAIVITIVRFVAYVILRAATRGSAETEVSSLLKTVFSIIIYIVSFFIIFQTQYPDVSLAPLFTGSTILGIVVGLALQDTLGNLFAGIAIQADQPFQVGDVISINSRGMGVVESVSWRGVKIRTFQNKLLVISNSVLGKETIEVAPKDNLNARIVFFNTLYAYSPARTTQLVREAVRQVENVSSKRKPVVRIRNFGDSGLDWEVKFWVDDYTIHHDTDALVRQRIWYVFQREKIHFAYPTRTVHIEPKIEELPVEETVNTRVERLNRVPIFAPLSEDEVEKLAKASKSRIYAPGESIVRMGQEGNSMFIIIRGSVSVQIPEATGSRIVNELAENDFFGEMSLLTGQPRSASVIASEETEVLQISKNSMKGIFESNPSLVQSISDVMGERKEVLEATEATAKAASKTSKPGVVSAIKKFFGLSD